MTQQDEDYQILVALSRGLQGEYGDKVDKEWERSSFGWIKKLPSRTVGAIGEKLIAGWCAARDFNVMRSPDSDADRVIENLRVEIKFSTLWKNGSYKFQQIRDQNYDALLCFGVSPSEVHAWIFRKTEIPFGELSHQHGGERGSDTWWIQVDPNAPPSWMMTGRHASFSDLRRFFSEEQKS